MEKRYTGTGIYVFIVRWWWFACFCPSSVRETVSPQSAESVSSRANGDLTGKYQNDSWAIQAKDHYLTKGPRHFNRSLWYRRMTSSRKITISR